MDGAGTRMRRGLLRRWSCAGLSWKTHRSTSALYCPRTALFARHYRLLGECRQNGLLNRELLQFAQIQLPQEMESRQVEAYQHKKGQLQQAIEERRPQIEQLKAQPKTLPKHIEIKDLPEQDRFHRRTRRMIIGLTWRRRSHRHRLIHLREIDPSRLRARHTRRRVAENTGTPTPGGCEADCNPEQSKGRAASRPLPPRLNSGCQTT